jgi:hypothetical protein
MLLDSNKASGMDMRLSNEEIQAYYKLLDVDHDGIVTL